MNFKNFDDWYQISTKDIRNFGGRGLLYFHKESIFSVLATAYPEHNWQLWKFKQAPRNFWNDEKNCLTALNQTK